MPILEFLYCKGTKPLIINYSFFAGHDNSKQTRYSVGRKAQESEIWKEEKGICIILHLGLWGCICDALCLELQNITILQN